MPAATAERMPPPCCGRSCRVAQPPGPAFIILCAARRCPRLCAFCMRGFLGGLCFLCGSAARWLCGSAARRLGGLCGLRPLRPLRLCFLSLFLFLGGLCGLCGSASSPSSSSSAASAALLPLRLCFLCGSASSASSAALRPAALRPMSGGGIAAPGGLGSRHQAVA